MRAVPPLLLALTLALVGCLQEAEEAPVQGPAPPELQAPPAEGAPNAAPRVVIDTRDPRAFAAGHDPGALNLQWGWDQLSGRVRSYLPDRATPVAVRAESASRAAKAKRLLEEYGYADVEVLEGEPGGATLSLMTCEELAARIAAGTAPTILDVRTPKEWERGVIDGAVTVEQDRAPALLPTLDPEQEYAVICAGGFRSGQFASLLQAEGFTRVHNVVDGMTAWYRR